MAPPNPKGPGPIGAAFGTTLMDRVNVFFKIRRYIKMVAERWIILVLCTVVGGGLAIYKVMNTQDLFEAHSEIGIAAKIQTREDINKAVVVEEINSFYDRQINYIKSEAVRSSTLKDMAGEKLSGNPPGLDGDAIRLKNNNILLTVTSTDLDYAKKYAQNWANEFINYRDQLRSDLVSKSARETRDEIKGYENEVNRVRNDLSQFQQTNHIYNAKTVVESMQKRLDSRETEYSDLKAQIDQLKGMDPLTLASQIDSGVARRPEDKVGTAPTTDRVGEAPSIDPAGRYENSSLYPKLKRDLELKQAEYKRAALTLLPKHPHMIKLTMQLEDLEQQVVVELKNLEDRRKARIESMELQAGTYPAMIKDIKDQLFGFRRLLNVYDDLKDRESAAMSQLSSLQKKLDSLNVPPDDEGTFTILKVGESGGMPINGNRSKTVATGFLLGLAIGLGIIYTLGRLDDRLELAEEIEAQLEEPVLGQIPLVDKKIINAERVLITRLDEHSLFAESVRGVRSAVMLGSSQGGPKQVMLVTSAVPGDGKTTFTVNFAVTLAIAGNRVLLVDADLRRGNIHGYFDLPRDPGYAEILQGELHWRDVVQKTEVATMHLISTGKLPANPGELLINPINRQFVEDVRQAYDYVVFDCPPLTAIDDTFSLVGSSDGILFVVRSGQTSMRFAASALDAVRKRGAQIMGLVLNGITSDNPYYYYKNYYHEYYNKGAARSAPMSHTPLPSARMAAPKVPSIEEEAKLRTGTQKVVGAAVMEPSKAEQFKAFRAAKRMATSEGTEAGPSKSGKSGGVV